MRKKRKIVSYPSHTLVPHIQQDIDTHLLANTFLHSDIHQYSNLELKKKKNGINQ